jgi:hypothetical protein
LYLDTASGDRTFARFRTVIEPSNGLTGKGHEDAWEGSRAKPAHA